MFTENIVESIEGDDVAEMDEFLRKIGENLRVLTDGNIGSLIIEQRTFLRRPPQELAHIRPRMMNFGDIIAGVT